MNYTDITGNGVAKIALGAGIVTDKESTVYADTAIGAAVITIGYVDDAAVFVPYTDGSILQGEQKRVRSGRGVTLAVNITGYTVDFKIGFAD